MIVCDTGPLVAAGLSRDPDHRASVDLFAALHMSGRPMLMPAPIVAEVGYLLQHKGSSRAESAFLRSLAAGDFRTVELTSADYARMADLVETYADLPLGRSDASVVALAERLGIAEVATLDHRHFRIVRSRHVDAFTLLP
ncbi:PIN domain-containing protein [Pseudonocardia sp. NPDC046786]|uniref:type II toxin-antitoxin system VapC family toxin n=1 Tax=Pseudonocardia sp. NPDC046786 TaxID=3155471 RepID=UPI0033D8E4A6